MPNRFLIVCGGSGYRLLGQRAILGIDAELQIDVSKENVSRDWKVKDPRSLFVDLDQRVGTTAVAFNRLREKLEVRSPDDPERRHIELLTRLFPTALNLERGLAQSPAVGLAAIAHPQNRDALRQVLGKLIAEYGRDIGAQNPVEVWIVSSTAGGTGEGTHRFVATVLAEYMRETFEEAPLSIHFIRIGQLTYRSINNTKTALNTFFGIAADAGFMLGVKERFPLLVTNWYYVDLPDVGKGDRAKRVRGEIVEMACKAIMLPDLQDDLQKLLVNNSGASIVVVRTGYWGKDFGSNTKYFETLKQLQASLADLISPNYYEKYIKGKPEPQFVSPALDEKIGQAQSPNYVLRRMEKAQWQFPHYRGGAFPKSVEPVRRWLAEWKMALRDLLEVELDQIQVDVRVDELVAAGEGNGGSQVTTISLAVPASIDENQEWFAQISNAHRVRAWATHLLGVDPRTGEVLTTGQIAELLKLADQLSKIYHGFDPLASSQKRAERAAGILGSFVRLVAYVNWLLDLDARARRLLERELLESTEVLKKTDEELVIARNLAGASPTTMVCAASLSQVIDQLSRKTWLRLLREAVRKGDSDLFRAEVLRGATGLTEDGLRYVLGLPPQADVAEIQNTLAARMGRMIGQNGEEMEGSWWSATPPNGTLEYMYRILPQVSRELESLLRARAEESDAPFRYIFTKFGTIGLYVLAFHGVSLNKASGDTSSAPAYLMQPLVATVRTTLQNWPAEPPANVPSGQLDVLSACGTGEVLYERAMRQAGLQDDDIAKLGQYFRLVN